MAADPIYSTAHSAWYTTRCWSFCNFGSVLLEHPFDLTLRLAPTDVLALIDVELINPSIAMDRFTLRQVFWIRHAMSHSTMLHFLLAYEMCERNTDIRCTLTHNKQRWDSRADSFYVMANGDYVHLQITGEQALDGSIYWKRWDIQNVLFREGRSMVVTHPLRLSLMKNRIPATCYKLEKCRGRLVAQARLLRRGPMSLTPGAHLRSRTQVHNRRLCSFNLIIWYPRLPEWE